MSAASEEVNTSESEGDKQCRLYRLDPVGRIDRELKELTGESLSSKGDLDAFKITQVDSMHYLGTEGTKSMLKLFPSTTKCILDLGSGFGGCARYVAKTLEKDDVHVSALELQANISDAAETLTSRCSLSSSVSHIVGDILDDEVLHKLPKLGSYDVVFSKLVVLHIPFCERSKLWSSLSQAAPGGLLYLEDYFEAKELSSEERAALAQEVGCPEIPNQENYVKQLSEAGYTDIKFSDVTTAWSDFVKERAAMFAKNKERHIRVHGEATFENMMNFYNATAGLFSGKGLGGAVITARIATPDEKQPNAKKQKN